MDRDGEARAGQDGRGWSGQDGAALSAGKVRIWSRSQNPSYRDLCVELTACAFDVAKARKTGQAIVAVFRRINEDICLVGRSHDGFFDLCIIRIRRAVSPFGGKARTA